LESVPANDPLTAFQKAQTQIQSHPGGSSSGSTEQVIQKQPISGDSAAQGQSQPGQINDFNDLAKQSPYIKASPNGRSGDFTNPFTGRTQHFDNLRDAYKTVSEINRAQTFGISLEGLTPGAAPVMIGNSDIGVIMNKEGMYQTVKVDGKRLLNLSDKSDMMKDPNYAAAQAYKDLDKYGKVPEGDAGLPLKDTSSNTASDVAKPKPKFGLNTLAAIGGAAFGSYMLYQGFSSLSQSTNKAADIGSISIGAISTFFSIKSLAVQFLKANPLWGSLLAAGVIGLMALLALGKKKDNPLDTSQGDVPGLPGTGAITGPLKSTTSASDGQKPWYQRNPYASAGSVFTIVAASALMAIGINLGMDGAANQSKSFGAKELSGVHSALQSSIGSRQLLPSADTGVLGKTFIQSSGNNGLTPDKVVYVSEEADPNSKNNSGTVYKVNAITLDYDGYRVDSESPNQNHIPFFLVRNGSIVPNPEASGAIAAQRSLLNVATAGNARTLSRAAATQLAQTTDHAGSMVSRGSARRSGAEQ
jgi:hypothetical protein